MAAEQLLQPPQTLVFGRGPDGGSGIGRPGQDHRGEHLGLPLPIVGVAGTTQCRLGFVAGGSAGGERRQFAEDLVTGDEMAEFVDDDLIAMQT